MLTDNLTQHFCVLQAEEPLKAVNPAFDNFPILDAMPEQEEAMLEAEPKADADAEPGAEVKDEENEKPEADGKALEAVKAEAPKQEAEEDLVAQLQPAAELGQQVWPWRNPLSVCYRTLCTLQRVCNVQTRHRYTAATGEWPI